MTRMATVVGATTIVGLTVAVIMVVGENTA